MSNVKNFVDEKTNRKIVDALCALSYKDVLKLSKNSGVPVIRLQDFVDDTKKVTNVDKGKLIIHLVNQAEEQDAKQQAVIIETPKKSNVVSFSSLKEFQQSNAG